MKKIINGKLYDTDKAVKVGAWDNHEYGDIKYICETLYRKKTGEYFVHGEGGAATKYAVAAEADRWKAGERIMPMAYDAAREWAEEHLTADEYQTAFKIDEDGDRRQLISLSLSAGTVAKLKRIAAQRGISQSALVEELIETM